MKSNPIEYAPIPRMVVTNNLSTRKWDIHVEHVEDIFIDGVGPVRRIWAIRKLGSAASKDEALKMANKEARRHYAR